MDSKSDQGVRIFEGTHCGHLVFDIDIKREDFFLDDFKAATRWKKEESRGVSCAPMYPNSDFHLHVSWRLRPERFSINITFAEGKKKHEDDEREPFAEQFIQWFAQFVAKESVKANVRAGFWYEDNERQSKFVLTIKAPIGPEDSEAEIDGISFTLPTKPEGVTKVWMTGDSEGKSLGTSLSAERLIEFRRFDPRAEVMALERVMDSVLRKKQ